MPQLLQLLQVFLLALTPIGELRAAIPVGVAVYHLNLLLVFIVSIVGNLVPVILLLLFLKPVSELLSRKFKTFERFFNWLFFRIRQRHTAKIKGLNSLALVVFVAIPLPMTGGWTGAFIAFLAGIPFKQAFLSIFSGVFLAGIIVTILTQTGIAISQYFGWKTLIAILILAGIGVIVFKGLKIRRLKII